MRVFLAGASGVIGRRLVPLLAAAGHNVAAMIRTQAKAEQLHGLGADPVVCDVFDLDALCEAVRGFGAEAVLHELTDLPDDPRRIPELAGANARMRRQGTRNLLVAANAAGAARFVAQSVAWPIPGDGGVAVEEHEHAVLDTTHALLDGEDGALAGALTKWLADVEGALDETFDEDSKKSAIGKLERLLEHAQEAQVSAVRRLVDPHDEDGPLARQRREILKAVKEETSAIKAAVAEVSEKIAVRKAEAELLEHTAIKGAAYEDTVHAELARIVEPYGDIAEQAGTTSGVTGGKKGDEVVTLNPDETRGHGARYVLEIKDRKLGLSAILAELDEAQANRGALASIAVFSRDANCPAAGPFTYHGTRALAVLDKDDPDPGALRLACLWARWTTRRQLADDHVGVDTERIEALIAEGSRALDRLASIRRCHTAARNKIQEAGSQVDDLGSELDGILTRLRSELQR